MSARVLQDIRPGSRQGGLVVGGHYTLPSGNVVVFDGYIRGGAAACRYQEWQDSSRVSGDQEVTFDPKFLQRYGRLDWGH